MSNGRFRQANREALITLAVYIFFFLWWTVFAFGLGSGDPENYSYVLGLPSWFFYSCVLGYPVVTILLWLVIKRWFKDIPLDGEPESAGPDNLNAASAGAKNLDAVCAGSENTVEKS